MQRIYTKLSDMLTAVQGGVSGIVVDGDPVRCPTGTKFVVNEALDIVAGSIDEGVLALLRDDLLTSMRSKTPRTVTVEGSIHILLDPVYPQARLIIFGGGHIALPLVKLGKMMDFYVTVADDRPAFANKVRFAEADEVICERFETVCENLELDPNTFVVIVTRGHRYDLFCLETVLRSSAQPAYIGMIGSRRKVAAIREALTEKGVSTETLNKVYAPIGLDIGAQTPEEIALSILAEIVMVKHYGLSNGLKTQTRGR